MASSMRFDSSAARISMSVASICVCSRFVLRFYLWLIHQIMQNIVRAWLKQNRHCNQIKPISTFFGSLQGNFTQTDLEKFPRLET
jgi:hypothetical protein